MQTQADSSGIRHEFIAIDEGLGQLLHVDERQPARDWVVPLGCEQVRDMQLAGGGRLLVSHHHGYAEFDLETGRRTKLFDGLAGVTAARRQADGRTILAGVDLDGQKGVVILELDARDQVQRRVLFEGDYVRLIRQTAEGTYLMSCNSMIREGDDTGRYLRSYAVDGFYHAWKALRLPDGRLLVSAGYGAFMVELDAAGRELRRFGTAATLPGEVRPFFYGMFQLLPGGHVVVANWQGHGPQWGASGVQLLEFDLEGRVVWQWSESARISSLQGILVLDGLDPARLHDERTGRLAPVECVCGQPR